MAVNYFNPKGIHLLKEDIKLKWASDTLFINNILDSVNVTKDSYSSTNIPNDDEQKAQEKKLKADDQKETSLSLNKSETQKEEVNEIVVFDEPKAITLEQAYLLFKKKVSFIDARDEADYLAGHITNSINIPFDDFENHKQKLTNLSKDEPLVIYCAGTDCDLSILLGNLLFKQGYKQVYIFFGGWNDWLAAKYPIENSSE